MGRALRFAVRFTARVVIPALVVLAILVAAGVVANPFSYQLHGDVVRARGNVPGVRVLFVGNALTFANDMPDMVRELALGDRGAPRIVPLWFTRSRGTLAAAAERDELKALLRDVRWDAVVLQENGTRAVDPDHDLTEFVPALSPPRARTILFMTWGYRDVPDDFAAMHARLDEAYVEAARETGSEVAPVGRAWTAVLRERPETRLWAIGGIRASRRGSYLAACVLYAQLTGRSPVRSDYTAGLPPEEAAFLRETAAGTVRLPVS